MLSMPEELRGVVIAIDEPQNFFYYLKWQSEMAQLFSAIERQRRKRQLAILMAAQDISELPTTLRRPIHVETRCSDMYFKLRNKYPIKQGHWIAFSSCDLKGLYTGMPFTWSRQRIFKEAQTMWKHYNTEEIVSVYHRYAKVNIEKSEINVSGGRAVEVNKGIPDLSFIDKIPVEQENPYFAIAQSVIESLKAHGMEKIVGSQLYEIMHKAGVDLPNRQLGKILSPLVKRATTMRVDGKEKRALVFA